MKLPKIRYVTAEEAEALLRRHFPHGSKLGVVEPHYPSRGKEIGFINGERIIVK